MTHHFLDLDGANVIATDQLLDARELIAEIFAVNAIGAIYGPAGTGKTFAVDQMLFDTPERQWVRTEMRPRPTLRDIRDSLNQCLGLTRPYASTAWEADHRLKSALGRGPRLVVIDESQWLNRECFEFLRHIHDDPRTHFSLLFVGGDGCYEVLRREPMLDSRLYAHLRFEPLRTQEVLSVIPDYHPVYVGVDEDLLLHIDGACTHGNFRNWAKFTRHAVRLCQRTARPRLDEEVAQNVFRFLGGGVGARTSALR